MQKRISNDLLKSFEWIVWLFSPLRPANSSSDPQVESHEFLDLTDLIGNRTADFLLIDDRICQRGPSDPEELNVGPGKKGAGIFT